MKLNDMRRLAGLAPVNEGEKLGHSHCKDSVKHHPAKQNKKKPALCDDPENHIAKITGNSLKGDGIPKKNHKQNCLHPKQDDDPENSCCDIEGNVFEEKKSGKPIDNNPGAHGKDVKTIELGTTLQKNLEDAIAAVAAGTTERITWEIEKDPETGAVKVKDTLKVEKSGKKKSTKKVTKEEVHAVKRWFKAAGLPVPELFERLSDLEDELGDNIDDMDNIDIKNDISSLGSDDYESEGNSIEFICDELEAIANGEEPLPTDPEDFRMWADALRRCCNQ